VTSTLMQGLQNIGEIWPKFEVIKSLVAKCCG